MRRLVLIPFTLLCAAIAGYAICRCANIDPHAREMIAAAIVATFAAESALALLFLARGAAPATAAQAGLGATVLQLLLNLGAAGALIALRLGLRQAFLLWLVGFYWISLVLLVLLIIREIKLASLALPAGITGKSIA